MDELHKAYRTKLYSEFARIGTALGSDKRLELLDLLAQGPRYVDALAAEVDTSVANASQHLQVLRNAKLVDAEREGTRVLYRLRNPGVLKLWLNLRDVAGEALPEVRELRREHTPGGLDGELRLTDLATGLRAGEIVLIDVRPAIEYRAGHISGAVHLPLEELLSRLDELPRAKRIVAYCRGEYCLFADQAVALLRQHGFDAIRLEGGWPEWSAEQNASTSTTPPP